MLRRAISHRTDGCIGGKKNLAALLFSPVACQGLWFRIHSDEAEGTAIRFKMTESRIVAKRGIK